jgi:hypothetical protein
MVGGGWVCRGMKNPAGAAELEGRKRWRMERVRAGYFFSGAGTGAPPLPQTSTSV